MSLHRTFARRQTVRLYPPLPEYPISSNSPLLLLLVQNPLHVERLDSSSFHYHSVHFAHTTFYPNQSICTDQKDVCFQHQGVSLGSSSAIASGQGALLMI